MMAAIAVDYLLDRFQINGNIGVAYVYCNYKTQEDHNVCNLLAAILKQLVQARPSLTEPVERLHKSHVDKGTKPSVDDLSSTLQAVLANLLIVYVVVDALDECLDHAGTRDQLVKQLQTLQAKHDLRLMITSRYIPEIVEDFKDTILLKIRASHDDMRLFITGQLLRLPKCIQRDASLQTMVQDKIVEAADGM